MGATSTVKHTLGREWTDRDLLCAAAAWDVLLVVAFATVESDADPLGGLVLAALPLLPLLVRPWPWVFRTACVGIGLLHAIPLLLFLFPLFSTASLLFAAACRVGGFWRPMWFTFAAVVAATTMVVFTIEVVNLR